MATRGGGDNNNSSRALVPYDQSFAQFQSGGNTSGSSALSSRALLRVAGDALRPFAHSPQSRGLLASSRGTDVPYDPSRLAPRQVSTHRPSYINSILIQSRGSLPRSGPCVRCRSRGSAPFVDCRHALGHFGGACGPCKWPDLGRSCSLVQEQTSAGSGLLNSTSAPALLGSSGSPSASAPAPASSVVRAAPGPLVRTIPAGTPLVDLTQDDDDDDDDDSSFGLHLPAGWSTEPSAPLPPSPGAGPGARPSVRDVGAFGSSPSSAVVRRGATPPAGPRPRLKIEVEDDSESDTEYTFPPPRRSQPYSRGGQ